jgi:hypothetical protein
MDIKKLDLDTLKAVRDMFQLHSDSSTSCNGYQTLITYIEEMENTPCWYDYHNRDILKWGVCGRCYGTKKIK